MAIPLKSPRDIDAMRRAGALLWRILQHAAARATPGTTTAQLAERVGDRIASAGATAVMPAQGFPGQATITLNEEVAHAPPGPRLLRDGDIATIDAALSLDGWCADAAVTVAVGNPSREALALSAAALETVRAAIEAVEPGRLWSQVALAAAAKARALGCSLVREYAGHGVGRALQEPPACPFLPEFSGNPASACQDFVLRPGMVFTIEPVLVLGRPEVMGLDDAWTVVTADRSAAAHEERTVAVTRSGALVLTAP